MLTNDQLACHECDLIVEIPSLSDGQKASCPRCGFVFTRYYHNAQGRLMALSLTSLIFMVLTLIFPFLIFTAQGNSKTVSFLECLESMGEDTYIGVVVFLLITSFVVPTIYLLSINYVLLSAKAKKALPFTKRILRLVFKLDTWNMGEIFLLGILVSMVKIASLAQVQFGWSFFAFVFYIASMAATAQFLDKYQIWQWINHHSIGATQNG